MKLSAWPIQFTFFHKKISIHWSALFIFGMALFLPAGNVNWKLLNALSCFFIICLHEYGHSFFANKRGYHSSDIFIYFWGGSCLVENPEYELDNIIIAWGGIIFQLGLAIPAAIFVLIFGNIGLIQNYIYLILWGYNIIIVLMNILPLPTLDGNTMWKIIPYVFNLLSSKISNKQKEAKIIKLPKSYFRKASKKNIKKYIKE